MLYGPAAQASRAPLAIESIASKPADGSKQRIDQIARSRLRVLQLKQLLMSVAFGVRKTNLADYESSAWFT
jgi:hypothetical protein